MTDLQHDLIKKLFKPGFYLMTRLRHSGRRGYMLYQGNANPVDWYSEANYKIVKEVVKKDKIGRITLNLNLVRQQHGSSLLKILYKKQKQKL